MSKSRGNVVRPAELINEVGADVVRYFLMREVPFGQDGDFSFAALKQRYNTELANDLGNLLNRSLSMLQKYRSGILGEARSEREDDRILLGCVEAMHVDVDKAMQAQAFHEALDAINQVVRHCNRYVEVCAPWALARNGDTGRLDTVLYHLVESLRLVTLALSPFMPEKTAIMMQQIMNEAHHPDELSIRKMGGWGLLAAGHQCGRPQPVFPRMD